MRWSVIVMIVVISGSVICAAAGLLDHHKLEPRLEALARGVDGRVGVCVQDGHDVSCVNGNARFSMQSVVKLLVGVAVMDAIDHGKTRLDAPVLVRREDLSLYVQPIAKLVTDRGYQTTVADLVRRAIVDSDSAATDILIARLSGPAAVQACIERLGITGIRIDRDERHLQTEIVGLEWKPEYVDASVLERAVRAVPKPRHDAAYRAYQTDVRDTATPRGMAAMLYALATGKLLSPSSTKYLMDVLEQTVTFPDRLKAGVAPGWKLGHKTGTSGGWNGVVAATNDVGVLRAPDGGIVSIAVFIADSKAPPKTRAEVMAQMAAATIDNYHAAR